MYSVMLATMLTAGAQTTNVCWLRCHGCHSCHSCYSSCHSSCHGRVVIAHGCHSYCSGCFCSCSCNWYSSCHCCSGVVVVMGGCHGCHSCSGWCHGCSGCWVSSHCCHSSGVVVVERREEVRGGGMGMGGGMGPRNEMERKAVDDLLRRLRQGEGQKGGERKGGEERKIERKEFKRDEQAAVPADRSRLVVSVPADARLWVDQVECPLPGAVRSFDTPNLDPQMNYSYTLRVAVQRNGQTVEDSRRVQLIPGQQIQVDFSGIGATRTVAAE